MPFSSVKSFGMLLINTKPFTYFANYYFSECCWSAYSPYAFFVGYFCLEWCWSTFTLHLLHQLLLNSVDQSYYPMSVTIVRNAVDKQFFIIIFCVAMDDFRALWGYTVRPPYIKSDLQTNTLHFQIQQTYRTAPTTSVIIDELGLLAMTQTINMRRGS